MCAAAHSGQTGAASLAVAGLRIAPPEAPVTGYMFGKGLYFAECANSAPLGVSRRGLRCAARTTAGVCSARCSMPMEYAHGATYLRGGMLARAGGAQHGVEERELLRHVARAERGDSPPQVCRPIRLYAYTPIRPIPLLVRR